MSSAGIVVEYNPFHNGHLYHLEKTKELCNTQGVIAVMSPNWVQRGEPAIIDKWERANMAVRQGVDLVLELPFIWATQSAREFARGAISILDATGIVKYQTFGSESADLNFLYKASTFLDEEPEDFRDELRRYLKTGHSYPHAATKALNKVMHSEKTITPNDVLGIEYLKAHKDIKTNITPQIIERVGSDYHDPELASEFSSATAIRKALKDSKSIKDYVPPAVLEILNNNRDHLVYFDDLEKYALYRLRTAKAQELTSYPGWEKGLENMLKEAAMHKTRLEDLVNHAITKRYTRGRINRYLVHLLIGLNREKIINFNKKGPPYLRILGMNSTGKILLKQMKKQAKLPILTRPAKELRRLDKYSEDCFDQEVTATSFYNLLIDKEGHDDYTRPAIMN